MGSKQMNTQFWKDFARLIERSLVPPFSNSAIRPCTREDFQEYQKTLLENLHSIESVLNICIQNEYQCTEETQVILLKVLIVIGEQHCKSPWNTDEIVTLTHTLSSKICKILKYENVTQILTDEKLFLSAVMFLRTKLMKDTWKSFPAAILCYKWLLKMVEKPLLKRQIQEVLPTALVVFDDYVQENQKLGLECINMIIEHCQRSKVLRNFNYDQVIFQALEKLAHKVEPEMIVLLYSCISNLLESLDYYKDNSNDFKWSERNEIFIVLLGNMELQSNPKARCAYIVSLKKLATYPTCGIWFERISKILCEYCEENIDMKVTNMSLDFLEFFITLYQPKSQKFYITLYSSLLKLKCKLHLSTAKELDKKVNNCISLMNKLRPFMSEEIMSNSKIASAMLIV